MGANRPRPRHLADAQQEWVKRLLHEFERTYFAGGVLSKRYGGTGNQSGAGAGGGVAVDSIMVDDDGTIVIDDDGNIVTE